MLPENYLKRTVRREIKISEIFDQAEEVIILGGEQAVPILEWDGLKISEVKGPAARLFQDHLNSFSIKE